jgi:hypothetical protein
VTVPVLLAIAGAAAAVIFWMYRARGAGLAAQDLAGAATDVLNAARRYGFRRQANTHPVDAIDKTDLAMGAIAVAFLELDRLPSADQQVALSAALNRHLNTGVAKADEIAVLGHWLVGQCNGPQPAIERLAKRLYRIDGAASLEPLMAILTAVAQSGQGSLSPRQSEAVHEIARHLRVR